MAQPVWPSTLTGEIEHNGFVREPAYDPTIRTPPEDGPVLVMATKTAVPLQWGFVYPYLTAAQLTALMVFWSDDANYGAVVVKFTDPTNSTDYFVRFLAKPASSLSDVPDRWRAEVALIQALGTYT